MISLIVNSAKQNKKYDAFIENKGKVEVISFGAKGYEDYTIHHDNKRKKSYEKRHQKNEDWQNPYKPGFWAKHLLWNKKTLEDSAKDIEEKFNIKIILAV
jgi:hypothetical protein